MSKTMYQGNGQTSSFPSLAGLLALALVLIMQGCASTATDNAPSASTTTADASGSTPTKQAKNDAPVPTAATSAALAEKQKGAAIDSLNKQISAEATRQASSKAREAVEEYRLGVGDVVEVTVFQVEEMTRKYRVNASGSVIFPLIGMLQVGGKTSAEVETNLIEVLGRDFLQDPQVSVYIAEYRSQQITVMGAVSQPSVHSIQQPRSILEMLSMSGGLLPTAGGQMYVETTDFDDKGQEIRQSLIVDVASIVDSRDSARNLVLRGGDSIFVPEAGVVFVEGEVTNPGAYPMKTETNVLKAISLAGGTLRYANEGSIQILRQSGVDTQVLEVSLNDVRNNTTQDLTLQDGDIIVVRADGGRKAWGGFWRGLSGFVGFNRGF